MAEKQPTQQPQNPQPGDPPPQPPAGDPPGAPRPPTRAQGEGDYEAARRYRSDVEDFVAREDIEDAARAAEPGSERERDELDAAEETGRSRSKGEDAHDVMSRPQHMGGGGRDGGAAAPRRRGGEGADGGPRPQDA